MLIVLDFLDDIEREDIFNVVLVEGFIYLSVFRDKYFEELVYFGIFLG